jgi:hypothetical protein
MTKREKKLRKLKWKMILAARESKRVFKGNLF